MTLAKDYIDFRSFDTDSSGTISTNELNIVFILASGNKNSIPNKPWFREFNTNVNVDKDLFFANAAPEETMSVKWSFCNEGSSLETLCHEISHSIGSLDIYEDAPNSYSLSLVSDGFVHLDPYNKIRMGFVQPQVITQSGTYTVKAFDPNNPSQYNVLKVPLAIADNYSYTGDDGQYDEFLLIENRQSNGYDAEISKRTGTRGIAIWHILGHVDFPSDSYWQKFKVETPIGYLNPPTFWYKGGYSIFKPQSMQGYLQMHRKLLQM